METARCTSRCEAVAGRWRVRAVVLLLLALVPFGCAPRQLEPLTALDATQDTRIQREIEARLAAEPAVVLGDLRIEVSGGTVAVHGSVRGIGAYQCVIRNASLVEGVRRVVDYLVIERGPRDAPCLAPRRFGEGTGGSAGR